MKEYEINLFGFFIVLVVFFFLLLICWEIGIGFDEFCRSIINIFLVISVNRIIFMMKMFRKIEILNLNSKINWNNKVLGYIILVYDYDIICLKKMVFLIYLSFWGDWI